MTVLPIRTVPDPILRQKAKQVKLIGPSVKKLIKDMLETMHAAPGRAGLAGPQVGSVATGNRYQRSEKKRTMSF